MSSCRATNAKVIAARVRILRPLTAEELARLPDDARALNDERQAAEKRRRLSEMAKLGAEKAARQREEIAAARDAGVKSPARYAFEMLAAITDRSSWRAINSSRYAALKFLVEHVSFDPNDFGAILGDYNGGFWIGENGAESLYALAIASENTSAAVSIEKHLGRKPFWQRGFARRGKPTPKVRTAVGDWIRVDGRNLKVTSIRDDKGYLNAQEYREVKRGSYTDEERVGGVVKVTHAQLLAGSTKAQGAEAVS